MDKKERYHKFIIDHMVNKTDIAKDYVGFPFYPPATEFLFTRTTPFAISPDTTTSILFFRAFRNYIEKYYGVKDGEIKIIWGRYVEIMESIINECDYVVLDMT